jgi:prephenate dehydratase
MKNQIIAYQGVKGAYSHLACKNVYPNMKPKACPTFEDAMELVRTGEAKLAMIPIENSTAGRVEEIYRLMPKMALSIIAEHFEKINHCLIGLKDSDINKIKYVYSHPQALAQCDENIKKLNLTPIVKFDTAGAVKEIKELNDPQYSAIASSLSAEIYDLKILKSNFQSYEGNTTRFIVLARESQNIDYDSNINYITSIIFDVKNIPAALYKSLGGFATNGVNIIKIESYTPLGKLHSSQFHIDIEGHPKQQNVKLALEELRFFAEDVIILGSYEKNNIREKENLFKDK